MRPHRLALQLQRGPCSVSSGHARARPSALHRTASSLASSNRHYLLRSQTQFRARPFQAQARSIVSRQDATTDNGSAEIDTRIRNPLDYIYNNRKVKLRMTFLKRRIVACCVVLGLLTGVHILMVTLRGASERQGQEQDSSKKQKQGWASPEKLDAAPNSGQPGQVVVVQSKPGQPEIKLDENGIELVPTGTSTVPHFPRTILLPTTDADPSASPAGAPATEEEYYLLGVGVRKVSWFGVEVYVLGLYVRTTDLPALQLAFVKHINPIGTSLISTEKATLRTQLLEDTPSLAIWDKVLRETGIRSAVRIVPAKGTDFAHLRDGWVRGITARTQAAAKEGIKEYDDEAFGASMAQFKALFGGKGKAPVGSVMFLTRDERGKLGVFFSDKKAGPAGLMSMGGLADERISRQVWLGYLAGKNVSSEAAQKSVVEGVMELVERPVGTVGKAIT